MIQKLILFISLTAMVQTSTIFDFNKKADITNWKIVDDAVMGGRSSGKFYLNEEGNGVFEGSISLENNGGFSSLRYRFDAVSTTSYSKIILTSSLQNYKILRQSFYINKYRIRVEP